HKRSGPCVVATGSCRPPMTAFVCFGFALTADRTGPPPLSALAIPFNPALLIFDANSLLRVVLPSTSRDIPAKDEQRRMGGVAYWLVCGVAQYAVAAAISCLIRSASSGMSAGGQCHSCRR